ncbi:serine/threonine-protein kinase [Actinomycetospora sp.]|uniref:serine/threonine-protein kinase n=1 Tax=Actinomycetospora sp. TaxID=1872135 RepID=UPI002F3F1EBF
MGPAERPDKYRLVRLEGSGGEASLWRAEVDLAGVSETVAVKMLRPEHHDDLTRISARWAEQAELLRFVTHPSVIGVREHFEAAPPHPAADRPGRHDVTTPGPALYLVMNWVPGLALRDWLLLREGREGTVAGLRLLEQVADALEMLHAGRATPSGRPVVHGDLSPGNVMVDDEGRAVLVDFGMVRLAAHHTRDAAGTPGFTAPEVWSRGEYSPAADRYGFAALGFYTLLGTPPPADEDQIAEQLFGHPFLANTPPGQAEQILGGFSADPARRPPVLEWLQHLRGAASTSARAVAPTAPAGADRGSPPTTRPYRDEDTRSDTVSRTLRRSGPGTGTQPRVERTGTEAAVDVETHLADCRDGPGELVWTALLSRQWAVVSTWWTNRHGGRTYHVKLRDRVDDWIVVVEMRLGGEESSQLVWASGAGGAMTECSSELDRWLALT